MKFDTVFTEHFDTTQFSGVKKFNATIYFDKPKLFINGNPMRPRELL